MLIDGGTMVMIRVGFPPREAVVRRYNLKVNMAGFIEKANNKTRVCNRFGDLDGLPASLLAMARGPRRRVRRIRENIELLKAGAGAIDRAADERTCAHCGTTPVFRCRSSCHEELLTSGPALHQVRGCGVTGCGCDVVGKIDAPATHGANASAANRGAASPDRRCAT